MTSLEKCVIGLGVSASALIVFAFAINHSDSAKTQNTPAASAPASHDSPAFAQGQSTAPAIQSAPSTASSASAIVPVVNLLPANATTVPPESLTQLSVMVNLSDARNQEPNKAQWSQALPAAKKLLEGPCDCAQRIWLTHFVEMGDYAVSGSGSANDYRETAKLMTTLGRSDDEAMALSKKPN